MPLMMLIARIIAYANDSSTNPAPSLADYTALGVVGVNDANLTLVNETIDKQKGSDGTAGNLDDGDSVNTAQKVQFAVDTPLFQNMMSISVPENIPTSSVVYNLQAAAFHGNAENDAEIIYSIESGDDAARFTIDPVTGELFFVQTPDFEAPSDADRDNTYEVNVRATHTTRNAYTEQLFTINVTDLNADNQHGASLSVTTRTTSDKTPVLEGTGTIGALITIIFDDEGDGLRGRIGDDVVYSTIVDRWGRWSLDTNTAIPSALTVIIPPTDNANYSLQQYIEYYQYQAHYIKNPGSFAPLSSADGTWHNIIVTSSSEQSSEHIIGGIRYDSTISPLDATAIHLDTFADGTNRHNTDTITSHEQKASYQFLEDTNEITFFSRYFYWQE